MNQYIGKLATLGMSMFCLIICLYVSDDIIEIVRMGIASIVMLIFYMGIKIVEVVRDGDKIED